MIKEAMLYEKLENNTVHCYLCSHHCRIAPDKFGFCGVRQNLGGKLNTHVWGEVIASHVDPIEKKPLYHFLPGSKSYSVATVGCNFRCGFCQNWEISQASKQAGIDMAGYKMSPEDIVSEAKKTHSRSISYTYTEPTIFFEYAYDTAKLAKKEGLYNIFVTNGFMTPDAIKAIRPYLDAANVDLKFFKESSYKDICKGKLQPVLDSISLMKELRIWVEVTTLVIPGLNDSDEELGGIAAFIAGVNKDIPWHISAFHPDYKFTDYPPTTLDTMKKAYDIGKGSGLEFVYLGNVSQEIDTTCPRCGASTARSGRCPKCSAVIPGVWD